ncbi:HAD-IA family hydrolase [Candidatus Micrarchaeota archaeon]|nr:HAD-IA family hydrolase [Candidatus Micrarchaeota archaeon]
MKFDAIIFDVDGVLIDVSQSYRIAIIRTVKQFSGKQISNADIDLLKQTPGFNNDWDASFALNKEITDPKQVDRTSDEYKKMKDYFQSQYLGELIFKEKSLIDLKTLELLSSKGLKMGVATSRPREEAFIALRTAGISPKYILERNVVAQEDAPEKPSPEPLLLAKKKINATNPVYVGDTSSDKLAAERAKMPFIYCKKNPQIELMEIENVNQLIDVI